jgi:hypothetical protein
MRWPVMFTTKAFEPVVNGDGDTAYGNVRGFGKIESAESYLESAELPTNSEAFGSPYTKANYSGILIQWTAGTSSAGLSYYNEPAGSNCLTFQLRVKSGYTANKGVGTVAIPTTTQAKKVFYYQGITTPGDLSTLYKMDSSTCTFTSNVCTVNIISAAPGIVAKNGTDIILDTDHDTNYIYGFTEVFTQDRMIETETLPQYITTTGNATYTLEANELGGYGTGAVIHVYDADGELVDDYMIVVFGDIDGNCMIDAYDMIMMLDGIGNVQDWACADEITDNATFFSCDITGDGVAFAEDYTILESFIEEVSIRMYPDQTYSGSGAVFY